MSDWISVKDDLPKEGEHVLVDFGGGYRPVREGYISRIAYNDATDKYDLPLWTDATEQFNSDFGSPDEITDVLYWMPMPEPRKP